MAWQGHASPPGQARPAACDALRVGVDLSGKAHLSGAAALAEMKCHTNVWGCYFDVRSSSPLYSIQMYSIVCQ